MMNKLESDRRQLTAVNSLVGLEVESHRVSPDGKLSMLPYPKALGDEKKHHFIKNDFLETQSEMITPPVSSSGDALKYLGDYQQALRHALAPGELMWPYSMPPKIRADHSDIRIAQTDRASYEYRLVVAKRRIIERTSECGVHVNLGFTNEGLKALGITSKEQEDHAYLKAAIGFFKYRWLLTYLFGSTPFAFDNYFDEQTTSNIPKGALRSIRNSHFGYGNGVPGSYKSVTDYVNTIEKAVRDKDLIADREYYGIVRLKGGSELEDIESGGIKYIELRTMDLDPLNTLGISKQAIDWIKLMFAYFVANGDEPGPDTDKNIAQYEKKNDAVALEQADQPTQFKEEGLEFIDRLNEFTSESHEDFADPQLLSEMKDRFNDPQKTASATLMGKLKSWDVQNLFEFLTEKSKDYQKYFLSKPLMGFENETKMNKVKS